MDHSESPAIQCLLALSRSAAQFLLMGICLALSLPAHAQNGGGKKNRADAAQSYAEGPGLSAPKTQREEHFTVHAVDRNGNPLTTGGDRFKVVLSGPEPTVRLSITDHGDGTYGVTFLVNTAGSYTLDVTLRGSPIRDMPAAILVLESPSPVNSYAEGPGLETPGALSAETFTIHAQDQSGSPIPHGGDLFEVSILGPGAVAPQVTDNEDGTYTVIYLVTVAGTYTVDVRINGASIRDMPRVLQVPAVPSPSLSYAEGPGLATPRSQVAQTFTIHAVDQSGSPLTQGGDLVEVTIAGPQAAAPQVADNHDGTYTVSYLIPVAGTYTVDARINGASIRDMPVEVQVLTSPSPVNSYAEGPGLSFPTTLFPQTFFIHALDESGAPLTHGGDPFTVTILGPQVVGPQVLDNEDGTYTVTYTVTTSGTYTMDVRINGIPIRDMPIQIQINTGP